MLNIQPISKVFWLPRVLKRWGMNKKEIRQCIQKLVAPSAAGNPVKPEASAPAYFHIL